MLHTFFCIVPDRYWILVSFDMLICHLCLFFSQMPVQEWCKFSMGLFIILLFVYKSLCLTLLDIITDLRIRTEFCVVFPPIFKYLLSKCTDRYFLTIFSRVFLIINILKGRNVVSLQGRGKFCCCSCCCL